MSKPMLAFVGRIVGDVLCECGAATKKVGHLHECINPECKNKGKKYVAIQSNAVLFYEVNMT